MSYRFVNCKWVICKNGVYFSLAEDEIEELQLLINDINTGAREFYKEDSRNH
jgi:hypothetical protein